MPPRDREILRELANRYLAVCAEPVQADRRALWRRHNSLEPTPPLIYARAFAWQEMPESVCVCADQVLRQVENFFRYRLFWHGLNDDAIFEPWVSVRATLACQGWGIEPTRLESSEPGGSFKCEYPLREPEDLARLRVPWHEVDEAQTATTLAKVQDAIGDLIPVGVDRGPAYQQWTADLATDLGYLRGIEHFMLDMMDRPAWLHQLVGFMRDGVLKVHAEAEQAGDWGLCNHVNQAMPYAAELPDPAPHAPGGVKRGALWCHMSAQEFTAVSPAMHEEFLLRYQMPIMAKFGLVAYGCCEDLTNKIAMLRQISNLRRIAVSPMANVPRCAEQIGRDYVFSYRPSPTDMVSYRFDEDRIRAILRRDLAACRNCHVDVTLKDVETVERDPTRVKRWVAITREIIAEIFG